MTDLAALAERFRTFAAVECGTSPRYRWLAEGIAGDAGLLALAAHGDHGPKPNLFLAAVHALLLDHPHAPLAAWYPSVSGYASTGGDPFPAFRAFALDHADEVRALMAERLVQTNEVARAGVLLPAFALVADLAGGAPLALVEVGASAGLLLLWDRYAYAYGDGAIYGDPASPVRIQTELRDDHRPPLPTTLPRVAARTDLDLNPLDVRDAAGARWLQALVWPDQPERMARLRAAIDVVRTEPPRLLRGDAVALLPSILAEQPEGAALVVFHCHTLNQFPAEARAAFEDVLRGCARPIYRVGLEYRGEPEMTLYEYRDGRLASERVLARYGAHGGGVTWMDDRL